MDFKKMYKYLFSPFLFFYFKNKFSFKLVEYIDRELQIKK